MLGVLALLAVGVLIGFVLHRTRRYRPEVGALLVALVTVPVGRGAGTIIGHPALGLLAAAPVVFGAFGIGFRLDQADHRAGKDRRRRA